MPARSWQVIIGAITGEGGILFYISKAIADAAMGGDGGDLTFTSPTKFMATGSCWQAVLLVLYYLMMFRCLAVFFPPYAGPDPPSSSLHEVHAGHLVQQPPCLRPPLPHLMSLHHLSSLRLIPGVSHLSCQAPMSRSSHSCKEPLLVARSCVPNLRVDHRMVESGQLPLRSVSVQQPLRAPRFC